MSCCTHLTYVLFLSSRIPYVFCALKTEVFPFLSPGNFKKASIEVRERISAWTKDVQLYAATHKQSVSVYRNRTHDFTTRLREVITEQAMPAMFEDDMN